MQKMMAREKLKEMYINSLKENKIPWRREWSNAESPYNAASGKAYRGINNLILSYVSELRGYKDPRWMTLNQANAKGYRIKARPADFKGDYGIKIEYWSIYDSKTKRNIDFSKYNEIKKTDPDRADQMKLVNRVSTVFNADQISGIPKYVKEDKESFEMDDVLKCMIDNMNIEVKQVGSRACYSPSDDKIRIPEKKQFHSEYAFESTLLHELAHSTGHESRMGRDLSGEFGSQEYAREELRAEISSSFVCQELGFDYVEDDLDNHKAYIQDWIKILEDDPNELFRAIKDAEGISEYMVERSDLELLREKENMKMI